MTTKPKLVFLKVISFILSGDILRETADVEMSPQLVVYMNFTPAKSADMKKTFSSLKYILSE